MKTSMCKEEPKCPFFSWLFSCFVMYSHATVWQLCSSPGISVEVGRTRNLEHTVWDVISKLYTLPPLPKYHQQFNTQVTWSLSSLLEHPSCFALPILPEPFLANSSPARHSPMPQNPLIWMPISTPCFLIKLCFFLLSGLHTHVEPNMGLELATLR